MGLVPGALVAAGRGGSGAGGRTIGPRAARFSPEDHHGGDACIGYLAFNGEFLAANAAPAAGDAILSAGWWRLPAAGWDRSGPHAPRPVEQRHPDPPPTASFPGQAVPTDELHPWGFDPQDGDGWQVSVIAPGTPLVRADFPPDLPDDGRYPEVGL